MTFVESAEEWGGVYSLWSMREAPDAPPAEVVCDRVNA
jgi:hypothetical protein